MMVERRASAVDAAQAWVPAYAGMSGDNMLALAQPPPPPHDAVLTIRESIVAFRRKYPATPTP